MYENIENAREKLRVERFCCCADLRTGCYIIGAIEWIFIILRIYIIASRTVVGQNQAVSYYDIEYKVCYVVISLIISFTLIWGAYKYRKHFLLPWLILKAFEAIMMIVVTIVFFILIFFNPEYLVLAILTFIAFVIGTCISWYFWIIVWNFYQTCSEIRTNSVAPEAFMDGIEKESHMA